ncbi:MAG: PKD domain-containing protein [Methanocorpusculum sp.]|nr:PKD domain-containing protein [Methanocorpusculum sp.]
MTVNFTAVVNESSVDCYKWEVHKDENHKNSRPVEYTYKEAGEYTVTLTVNPKNTTKYNKTEKTIKITVTLEKLQAFISVSPADEGEATLKVTFTGTAKGNPASWEWDFDDGSSTVKNETKVEHSFTKAGNYNVRLTIRDETGSTASTSKLIEVTDKPKTTSTTATPTKSTAQQLLRPLPQQQKPQPFPQMTAPFPTRWTSSKSSYTC